MTSLSSETADAPLSAPIQRNAADETEKDEDKREDKTQDDDHRGKFARRNRDGDR
jgi:hypothetical protein